MAIKLLINTLLFFTGIIMTYSGMVLQIGFHMGGPHGEKIVTNSQSTQYEQIRAIDPNQIVSGLNYHDWSSWHKYTIVVFSLLMIYHFYLHWKWYKVVITKHLISKNKEALGLSVLFLLVAITGLIPWFIDLTGGTINLRMLLIEIHDKITLLLVVFLLIHFVRRAKWFATAYTKFKKIY